MLLLSFIKDQATANETNPKIINIFSLVEKFNAFLKKIIFYKILFAWINNWIFSILTMGLLYKFLFRREYYLLLVRKS